MDILYVGIDLAKNELSKPAPQTFVASILSAFDIGSTTACGTMASKSSPFGMQAEAAVRSSRLCSQR